MFAFRVDEGESDGGAGGVGAEEAVGGVGCVRGGEEDAGVGEDGAGLRRGGGWEAEVVDPEVAEVEGAGGGYGVLEGLGECGEGDVGGGGGGGSGWVAAVG